MATLNTRHSTRLDPHSILYVDDEQENLRVFELTFRAEFSILTATCAEDALRILADHPVAVVVSDHRMQGMQGTVFLSHARELAPASVRILMTAYGDVETLGSAINSGSIYRYIAKPWDPDEVRQTLRGAVDLYQQSQDREQAQLRLEAITELASSLGNRAPEVDLPEATLRLVTEDLGFDGAAWLIADPEDESLRWASQMPAGDGFAEHRIGRRDAPEFMEKLRRGDAQLLSQLLVDTYEPSLQSWVSQLAADSLLVIPIRSHDRLLAALAVDNRGGGALASRADRVVLEAIAGVVALALADASESEEAFAVSAASGLASVGGLSSTVFRDLAPRLERLRAAFSTDETRVQEDFDDLCASVESIAALVLAPASSATRHLCDLGSELALVCEQLAARTQKLGVEVELDLAPNTPKFQILPEPFRHLVRLLLKLSLQQLSGPGQIWIAMGPADSGAHEGVALEIRNDGASIDLEEVDASYATDTSRTGVATPTAGHLAACRYLVEALGGSLAIAGPNIPGGCSRVWLPAPADESSPTTELYDLN